MRYLLKQRIELQRPVTYIDATNLTRRDRRPFIALARKHGCEIEALFFDIPLDVCKARNSSRKRLVPNHALDLMAAKLVPPSIEEGLQSSRSRSTPSLKISVGVSRLITM